VAEAEVTSGAPVEIPEVTSGAPLEIPEVPPIPQLPAQVSNGKQTAAAVLPGAAAGHNGGDAHSDA
jgi:hypothetical protein